VSVPVESLLKVLRDLIAPRAITAGELVHHTAVAMPGPDATELFGRVLEADVGQQVPTLLQTLHRLQGYRDMDGLILNA